MLDKKLTFGGAFLMSKYTYEEKLEAVLRVIDDGMSYGESAYILGTAKEVVRRWVARYNQFGSEGLIMKHGTYSGDFKLSVIKYMHDNHLSLFEATVKFGIPSSSTLGKWERIYYEEGEQGLYIDRRGRKPKMSSTKTKKKEINEETKEDLIAEVQRLRMENEYLKKLQALVQKRVSQEDGKKQ